MPNWCLNSLDITGPQEDLDALLAQAALKAISKNYPALHFQIFCEDEGAYFEGTALYQDGRCLKKRFEQHPEGRMIEGRSMEEPSPKKS